MLDTLRSKVVWEYWLPTPFASFPFTSPPVRHHVPSGFKRTLHQPDAFLVHPGPIWVPDKSISGTLGVLWLLCTHCKLWRLLSWIAWQHTADFCRNLLPSSLGRRDKTVCYSKTSVHFEWMSFKNKWEFRKYISVSFTGTDSGLCLIAGFGISGV